MAHGDRGGPKKKAPTNKGHYDPGRSIWVRDAPPAPKRRPKAPTLGDKLATVWAAEHDALAPATHPPHPVVPRVPLARKPPVSRPKQPPLGQRYKWAVAAPVSQHARQKLADTMTPRRRREVIEAHRALPSMDDEIRRKLAHRTFLQSLPDRAAGAVGRGAEWAWQHPDALSRGATWAVTHPGGVAHGARVGIQAAGLGDLRRIAHPAEAVKADRAANAHAQRRYETWRRKNPKADPSEFLRDNPDMLDHEGMVPWGGAIKGALRAAIAGRGLARTTGKTVAKELAAGEKAAASAVKHAALPPAESVKAIRSAPGVSSSPAYVILTDGSRHLVNPLSTATEKDILLLDGNLVDTKVVAAVEAGDGTLLAGKRPAAARAAKAAKAPEVDPEAVAGGVRYEPGHAPPPPVLYHGSPEGAITKISEGYHTKAWREGVGFYLTENPEKAAKYAGGKTASAARKTGKGAVSTFRLAPDAKVLNVDAAPADFWRGMAEHIVGEKVDPKLYQDWARDVESLKGASEGVTNRARLQHFLTGWGEMSQSDAFYAIEEAIEGRGFQATLHHENGVPVYIVKDPNAVVHVPPETAPAVEGNGAASPAEAPAAGGNGAGPPVEPPVAEAVPDPVDPKKFRRTIVSAKRSRRKTDISYSEQRGKRFLDYEETYAKGIREGLSPEAAHDAARKKLAGELDRPTYKAMNQFTDQERQDMIGAIGDSKLKTGEKNRAIDAIKHAIDQGKAPQTSQIKLLERVFDPKTVEKLVKNADERTKIHRWLVDVAGIPRSLQSALDLSYLFRQALTAGIRHPKLWSEAVGPSLRAAKRANHEQFMTDLANDPEFARAEKAGVDFTSGGSANMALRDEQFASALADKIPGVGMSQRTYNNFLNDLRMKMWKHHVERMEDTIERRATRKGLSGDEYEAAITKGHKDLARFINSMTGRGPIGKKDGIGERAAPLMSALFFSPRLIASRLDLLLSPLSYLKVGRVGIGPYSQATPYVRKEAVRSMLQTVAVGMGVLAAAKEIPGVEVSTNPVATDFGRIRIGDTRIDIWGGFQPQARLLARLATGRFVGSSGKEWNLDEGGFGHSTRADIMLDFLRSKASPNLSFAWDAADRQNMIGDPFRWRDQWLRLTPILAKDIWDTYQERGPLGAAGIWGLGALGIGASTYPSSPAGPPKPDRSIPALPSSGSIYGRSGGGQSIYSGGAGGGGSIYAP